MYMRMVTAPVMAIALLTPLHAQQKISEDRDLLEIDLSGWDCHDQLGGSAKTPDGVERNHQKNRSAVDLTAVSVPDLDTAALLKHVGEFDAATKGKRRKDLTEAQREQLATTEKQIVSLTAYMVLAYAGPPESTNCASVDFHDWHLEMFERPLDHSPTMGDPTPIIAEITPRTQNALFRGGIRIQQLAGFFRRPDLESERAAAKPRHVRVTGYLLWDDDHNGKADVGATIESIGKSKYHNPWRSTAWEIHPVIKIEPADPAAAD